MIHEWQIARIKVGIVAACGAADLKPYDFDSQIADGDRSGLAHVGRLEQDRNECYSLATALVTKLATKLRSDAKLTL